MKPRACSSTLHGKKEPITKSIWSLWCEFENRENLVTIHLREDEQNEEDSLHPGDPLHAHDGDDEKDKHRSAADDSHVIHPVVNDAAELTPVKLGEHVKKRLTEPDVELETNLREV